MFKIPEGQEVNVFGFTVYDTETGDPVDVWKLIKKLGGHPQAVDDFVLTEGGFLYLTDSLGNWFSIPKKGKYIIQFAIDGVNPNCPYMRY